MKLVIEMFEKEDYENINGLDDKKLKELFKKRIRELLKARNSDKIKIKLIKNGK